MPDRHFILATAGHVDHGKSSLVNALTGIDPDRLPEEKARGITIDLGFAPLRLQAPGHDAIELGIVDVPGHEDFVKNMVAGVGCTDAALLVVAADDGWMPQTEEHLQILLYLGVRHATIALTKSDLVTDVEERVEGVRERLRGTPFEAAPIIPTSVATGSGLAELKGALEQLFRTIPLPVDIQKARVSVDRVFVLRGVGTVVTGTLAGGRLQRGQMVEVQPKALAAKVRALQNHGVDLESAIPGMRVALNIPDVSASEATSTGGVGVSRGDVITLPGFGGPGMCLDVFLERSGRETTGRGGVKVLKNGTRARLHAGTSNGAVHAHFLEVDGLSLGQSGLAQLRLEEPLFIVGGDRFILRDWSQQTTLAGGVVLDANSRRDGLKNPIRTSFLWKRFRGLEEVQVWVEGEVARGDAPKASGLLRRSRFQDSAVQQALGMLCASGVLVRAADSVVTAEQWKTWRTRVLELIDEEHRTHPERIGLPLAQLRAGMGKLLPTPELIGPLVIELSRAECRQVGIHVQRVSHVPKLPPTLDAAGRRIRAAMAAKPLEPPSRKELAPDPVSVQALRFLIETGEALEVGPELVMSWRAAARATQIIREFLKRQGSATTSELREALGSSRRVVIPILEKLDRDGVTRREGDRRVLKS